MGMNYITEVAREASAAFVTGTRPDGSRYIKNTDNAPAWLTDAVRDAHGDMLPDDVIYQLAADACEHIADANADARSLFDRVRHEFADGAVDTYDADRLAWVASSNYRTALVDEVHEDNGTDRGDLMDQIALGQYAEAVRVFDAMAEAIEREAEERENQDLMELDTDNGDAWQDMAPARSIASVMFEEVA